MLYDRKIKYFDYRKNDERIRGAGFAKIEARKGICDLTIQISGLNMTDSFSRQVYLIARHREEPICSIDLQAGRGMKQLRLPADNLCDSPGNRLAYEDLEGIRIPIAAGVELYCQISEKNSRSKPEEKWPEKYLAGEEIASEGEKMAAQAREVRAPEQNAAGMNMEEGNIEEGIIEEGIIEEGIVEEVNIEKQNIKETTTEEISTEEIINEAVSVRKQRAEEVSTGESTVEYVNTKALNTREVSTESANKKVLNTGEASTECVNTKALNTGEVSTESTNTKAPNTGEESTEWENTEVLSTEERDTEERDTEEQYAETPQKQFSKDEHRTDSRTIRMQEDKWQQLSAIYPHIKPFRDEREYLKLNPEDFVIFNSRFYKLVHNSFLLHGYYNYQHLILARMEQRGVPYYYIGVPGNFYDREKQVAVMFGFESFECQVEPADTGDYGYYMIRAEL